MQQMVEGNLGPPNSVSNMLFDHPKIIARPTRRGYSSRQGLTTAEGSHRGLVRRFAKPVRGVKPLRGFESLSLRHVFHINSGPALYDHLSHLDSRLSDEQG